MKIKLEKDEVIPATFDPVFKEIFTSGDCHKFTCRMISGITGINEKYLTKMADKMGTVLFKTKIRRSISVTEYIEAKTDLLNYDPKGNSSLDYRAFGEEFLKRLSELEGKHFG